MSEFLTQFHETVAQRGGEPCWRFKAKGQWHTLSWDDVALRVQSLATWFVEQGLQPGDRVAIWAGTRWEWCLADMAVLAAGGVVVPVYHNLPLDQAKFVIGEPECRFLVLGEVHPAREVMEACPSIEATVSLCEQSVAADHVIALDDILGRGIGDPAAYRARWQARRDDELASIVYTSGTSGTPKGVELTLKNFHAEIDALHAALPFPHHYECLTFLPLAHIVARVLHYYQLLDGFVSCFAESIDAVGDNMREVRPHFFVGVPRVYEKIQGKLLANVRTLPPLKQKLFAWSREVRTRYGNCVRRGRSPSLGLSLSMKLAHVIQKPVHEKMGGRMALAVSGGAPLAAELGDFFYSVGLTILEGYGLTETTAAVAVNTLDRFQFGTVGPVVRDTQLRIADDGEILVKGPTVFQGYYQREEATQEVLTEDGWFHTGDVGEVTPDGFVRITDRKKDLIKTSGGKYIAPQPIEASVKRSALIADALVHGDRRKYLSALITLEEAAVRDYAAANGIAEADWTSLTQHAKIQDRIQSDIAQVNEGLASWETIKRFVIIPESFGIASGELTPTMKVRRQVVCARYQAELDALYSEDVERSA